MAIEGARLWPLVESLGDAATATNGTQPVLQGLMQQLGTLCDGGAELWESTSDAPQTTARWRLRASYSPQPLVLHGAAGGINEEQIARVATTLRTLVSTKPTVTLALPIWPSGACKGYCASPRYKPTWRWWTGSAIWSAS